MATVRRDPRFPDLLIVEDRDAFSADPASPRTGKIDPERLLGILNPRPDGSPVGRGTHDFWVVHPIPGAEHGIHFGNGLDEGLSPRPFRGIVRMQTTFVREDVPGDDTRDYFNTLGQELGHAWLVPEHWRAGGAPVLGSGRFQEAALSSGTIPWGCFLGRDDRHWSPYFDGGQSPVEGADWLEEAVLEQGRPEEETMRRFALAGERGERIENPGPATVFVRRFSDMDLFMMGSMTREEAYPPRNEFALLRPQWVLPLGFEAGMLLVLDTNDVVTFGFTAGFQTLRVARTGQTPQDSDISGSYLPWNQRSRVGLRVARSGQTVDFSFQIEPQGGPPSPRTSLLSMTLPTIRAVGYFTKTSEGLQGIVDVSFRPLSLHTTSGTRTLALPDAGSAGVVTSNYLNELSRQPSDKLWFVTPKAGPRLNRADGELRLVVSPDQPGAFVVYDLASGVDDAPRLIAAAPAGDFTADGSVRIERTTMAPWAGGAIEGRKVWGQRKLYAMRDVQLDDPPGCRTQPDRAAFIVLTDGSPNAPLDRFLPEIDALRRGAESYWSVATRGRRTLETRLVPAAPTAAFEAPAAWASGSEQHVFYRGEDHRLHTLRWNGSWQHADLGSSVLARPDVEGAPAGHDLGGDHVFYRSGGRIIELFWSGGCWHRNDLTVAAGADAVAASAPSSWVLGGGQHVVFRGSQGHVMELRWSDAWRSSALTAVTGAPLAAGRPAGYVLGGSQHVVYRATDGHVHELWWDGAWHHNDLTAAASAHVNAASDPIGYAFGTSQQVVYLGTDGHLHCLSWNGRWRDDDAQALAGAATPARGRPTAHVFGNGHHLFYRATDDTLHEVWWDGAWHANDLTRSAGRPPEVRSDPASWVLGSSQHVIYVGADHHVHELRWSGGGWQHADLTVSIV
jgi:hypothetical protein